MMIQGSTEWLQARAGSLGASQVHDALATTKSGWAASRANIMATLICERLTGVPCETFVNDAMRWGTATEPQARAAYARRHRVEVVEVSIVRHPEISGTHASPDGLVGESGLIEIKCPNTATHLDTLESGAIPAKYLTQMAWQMACCDRDWCDYVSFDPRLPEHLQLFVKRVERDVTNTLRLESEVSAFLAELDAKLAKLSALYPAEREAA